MQKLKGLYLFAALLAFVGLVIVNARSAELEGALQYPPSSVGQDAQPPPPAGMMPQAMTPRRIQLGVSGSSVPPNTQRFYTRPPLRLEDHPGLAPQSGSGG
jgi:hypothetical protein